ncbi:MAG: MCE family protein [Bacteroidota bacterium]|nr:MCE family protein [Bacteroidota bacterium]
MKISNETKVGALTAVAITLMILGFNYLKGRSLFKTGNFIYAKYPDAKGLMVSNPVYVNGYQVGSVYEIENIDQNLRNISVAVKLKDSYNIPENSVAEIMKDPLGTPSVEITLGDSKKYLASGDTINTRSSPGLFNAFTNRIMPAVDQLQATIITLNNVLKNINSVFDPNTKHNLQDVIANINTTTASLIKSSASLEAMLNKENGSITQSLNNVNSFTKNLADNNEKVTQVLNNVETTTDHLSKADISGSVASLKTAVENLNIVLNKLNSKEGSLGLLVNDKVLYNNLTNTVRSANILMDDLRAHPKRYVNISVFGKKDKTGPLKAPLSDSTRH